MMKALGLISLACCNFLNATVTSQLIARNTDLQTFAMIYLIIGGITTLVLLTSGLKAFEVKLKDEP